MRDAVDFYVSANWLLNDIVVAYLSGDPAGNCLSSPFSQVAAWVPEAAPKRGVLFVGNNYPKLYGAVPLREPEVGFETGISDQMLVTKIQFGSNLWA